MQVVFNVACHLVMDNLPMVALGIRLVEGVQLVEGFQNNVLVGVQLVQWVQNNLLVEGVQNNLVVGVQLVEGVQNNLLVEGVQNNLVVGVHSNYNLSVVVDNAVVVVVVDLELLLGAVGSKPLLQLVELERVGFGQ